MGQPDDSTVSREACKIDEARWSQKQSLESEGGDFVELLNTP